MAAALMFALNILPRTLNWRTQAAAHRRLRRGHRYLAESSMAYFASEYVDALPWSQLLEVPSLERGSLLTLSANLRWAALLQKPVKPALRPRAASGLRIPLDHWIRSSQRWTRSNRQPARARCVNVRAAAGSGAPPEAPAE